MLYFKTLLVTLKNYLTESNSCEPSNKQEILLKKIRDDLDELLYSVESQHSSLDAKTFINNFKEQQK